MALKVKLVRSTASRPEDQRKTVLGLGLKKLNQERILQDTPAIRGMIAKVSHLVSWEEVEGEAPVRARRQRKAATKAKEE
ncbi:MAG: 50S ribosomal protein L30 [Pseudomonadota bacterium]|nr:MAG: 50S ribosomal protein L30 [Pseudomonadota bacterium]